jgi:5,6-dimethylbenzimidazole synthase
MKFDPSHTDVLLDLLRWRRDARHFTGQPVTEESLAVLKQAMALAPSVGNSQPWRVVSVETSTAREQIIANHKSANQAAAELYDEERRREYCALKLAALEEAPVQLAIFTDLDPSEGHGLGRRTMPETLPYSTVLAIHGLWLAARSMNLGVGWVSILDPEDVERLLGVGPSWHLTAYLCIGHPKYIDDTAELERVGWQKGSDTVWLVK